MVASTASSGKAAVGAGEGGAEAEAGQGSGEVGCSMEELVGLCKRRGFVFPSSEVSSCLIAFYLRYLFCAYLVCFLFVIGLNSTLDVDHSSIKPSP